MPMESEARPAAERVDAVLFGHLLGTIWMPLAGSAIGASVVAAVMYVTPMRFWALRWLALVYVLTGVRTLISARARARFRKLGYQPAEANRFALTVMLSGLAWGLGGLMVRGSDANALVILVSAENFMVLGGIMTLGGFMTAFLAFALPAILPMAVVLLLSETTSSVILGIYSLIFLGAMIFAAHLFNLSLRKAWQANCVSEDLLAELTDAHHRLAIAAETDGLTGLANRTHFDRAIEAECARLGRSGAPLSLIMLDIDHFKAFNDRYGHVAGDDCLRRVAQVLQECLERGSDLAARYGGEEFAGLLPDTDSAGAYALAETIRAGVAGLALPHAESGAARHVTASLGVATAAGRIQISPTELIGRADRQLYRAKSEGRNRICQADPREEPA